MCAYVETSMIIERIVACLIRNDFFVYNIMIYLRSKIKRNHRSAYARIRFGSILFDNT